MTIADLFVNVGFAPDTKSLEKVAASTKSKLEGIAKGVKGLFAMQAISAAAGAASRIAGGLMNAAQNAAQLDKMAKRAGLTVEQLQKKQGKKVILSQSEVDTLKQVNGILADINTVKDRIIAGTVKMIAPIVANARNFLKSIDVGKIADAITSLLSSAWDMIKPVFELAKELLNVFMDALPKLWGMLKPLLDLAGKTVKDLFGFILENIPSIKGMVEDSIENIMSVLSPAIDIAGAVFENIVYAAKGLWKIFKPLFDSIRSISKMIMHALGSVLEMSSRIFKNSKGGLDGMLKIANLIMKPIKIAFILLEEIFAIFDDGVEGFYENQASIKPLAEKMKAARDWIMETIEKIYNFMFGLFESIGTWVEETAAETLAFWGEAIPKIGGWISELYDDTKTGWQYIFGEMKAGIDELWAKAAKALDWINAKIEAIKQSIFGVVEKAKELVSGLPGAGLIKSVFGSSDKGNAIAAAKENVAGMGTLISGKPQSVESKASTTNSSVNNSNTYNTDRSVESKASTTNNHNLSVTVNVSGKGDKAEITRAVEAGINQSRLSNMAFAM